MQAIWSVHDVSPATVAWADRMVRRLTSRGASPMMILVIPAGEWPAEAIELLRRWEAASHVLALHGWDHRALRPADTYHRIHSVLLSRDAAEHLSRGKAEMLSRIERGRAWFAANGLAEPRVYVPPAWALGAVSPNELGAAGFQWVESLTGIHDTARDSRRRLPLIGFEADNRWRSAALRASNTVNFVLARLSRRPIRIAVHPGDDSGLLGGDLERWIRRGRPAVLPGQVES